MGNTASMTRNQNHDDDGVTPWSDLNHDVLFVVMMKLGVIDFVSFSGVCKSWRSLALSNRKMFMASRPPMPMRISNHGFKKKCYCHIEDIQGRKFKIILPHFGRRTYVGLTCGYLIFFDKKFKTRNFWLVNPITRHQLHFPNVPYYLHYDQPLIKAILVYSPSIYGWVFIMLDEYIDTVWCFIAGKKVWTPVSTTFHILDLHTFMGKIYIIDENRRIFELRLNPELNLTLLEIKNCMEPHLLDRILGFVSSGENLHMINYGKRDDMFMVQELDFGEMKWVMSEKTVEKYAFFFSKLTGYDYFSDFKAVPWSDAWSQNPWSRYKKNPYSRDDSGKYRSFFACKWYFPHECMDINLIDE